MNSVIFQLDFFGKLWLVTPWKIIGYLGVALFAGRWLVQMVASHRRGKSHMPRLFWYMSLSGSLMLLSYFAFSEKNDSVGILSNLFPCVVSGYNLFLDFRNRNRVDNSGDLPGGES